MITMRARGMRLSKKGLDILNAIKKNRGITNVMLSRTMGVPVHVISNALYTKNHVVFRRFAQKFLEFFQTIDKSLIDKDVYILDEVNGIKVESGLVTSSNNGLSVVNSSEKDFG